MRFELLATDYDGTLARHGTVETTTLQALERLRAAGRRAFMVTGRELHELKSVFSRFDLFDLIVAENGAVLHYPATGKTLALHEAPPRCFADTLRARGVSALSVGQVIVATTEPYQTVVLETIRNLGLELEIIFNKGAVMVLPTGVNKATGLKRALHGSGLTPKQTVAIGDAENDHAFLDLCGCGVAVSNAVPMLKARADYVTRASHGDGVAETIDLMLSGELAEIAAAARARRQAA